MSHFGLLALFSFFVSLVFAVIAALKRYLIALIWRP
jgi:hypothetical protein